MPSGRLARLLTGLLLFTVAIAATGFTFRDRLQVGVQPDGRILVPNGQTP